MKLEFLAISRKVLFVLLISACGKTSDSPTPPNPPAANPYKVSTYAGKIGVPGFVDGTSQLAQFRIMSGICVNGQGILYAADPDNNRIRKIDLDSSVSTYAGDGVMGFADGPASSAQFFKPTDVALDANGNLIVADIGNHRIRKITPAGIVSTIAGSGTQGYADGNAAVAKFDQPDAVCVDPQGNIFVSDMGNRRIRKISTTGEVSTIAGNGNRGFVNGTALNAEFDLPFDIQVDGQGNLYVSDLNNSVIRKISNTGMVSTYAGTVRGFADGPLASAKFDHPWGLVLDTEGNLIIADAANNRIRKITTATGVVTTIAGKGTAGYTNGNADSAEFAEPRGIAVNSNGVIYVGDALAYCIRKISK